jgi:hypothetical protein
MAQPETNRQNQPNPNRTEEKHMSNHAHKNDLTSAQSVSLYDPQIAATQQVCPHCLVPLAGYAFTTPDGVRIDSYTCATHGDVVPRRSAVANPTPIPAYGPRTGTHPLAVYTPDRNTELRRFAAKFARPITSLQMECYA